MGQMYFDRADYVVIIINGQHDITQVHLFKVRMFFQVFIIYIMVSTIMDGLVPERY